MLFLKGFQFCFGEEFMDVVVNDGLARNVKQTFQQKAHFRLSLNNSDKKQKNERVADGEGGGGGGGGEDEGHEQLQHVEGGGGGRQLAFYSLDAGGVQEGADARKWQV